MIGWITPSLHELCNMGNCTIGVQLVVSSNYLLRQIRLDCIRTIGILSPFQLKFVVHIKVEAGQTYLLISNSGCFLCYKTIERLSFTSTRADTQAKPFQSTYSLTDCALLFS